MEELISGDAREYFLSRFLKVKARSFSVELS